MLYNNNNTVQVVISHFHSADDTIKTKRNKKKYLHNLRNCYYFRSFSFSFLLLFIIHIGLCSEVASSSSPAVRFADWPAPASFFYSPPSVLLYIHRTYTHPHTHTQTHRHTQTVLPTAVLVASWVASRTATFPSHSSHVLFPSFFHLNSSLQSLGSSCVHVVDISWTFPRHLVPSDSIGYRYWTCSMPVSFASFFYDSILSLQPTFIGLLDCSRFFIRWEMSSPYAAKEVASSNNWKGFVPIVQFCNRIKKVSFLTFPLIISTFSRVFFFNNKTILSNQFNSNPSMQFQPNDSINQLVNYAKLKPNKSNKNRGKKNSNCHVSLWIIKWKRTPTTEINEQSPIRQWNRSDNRSSQFSLIDTNQLRSHVLHLWQLANT